MRISIRTKILPLAIVGILVTAHMMASLFVATQRNNLASHYEEGIEEVRKSYGHLIDSDTKALKVAMIDFMTNNEIKSVFLENDRDKLYEKTQGLYAQHKDMGLTHFYFHRPDGTNFLRVHASSTYDDVINRSTFLKSKAENGWGTGIELGKTAYALRAVHPYYNGEKLMGYLEFGEEIDHFNELIKTETEQEVVTIADKSKISEQDWAGIRQTSGEANNFADMENYVVVSATDKNLFDKKNYCWTEKGLDSIDADKGKIFGKYTNNGRSYVCGGFTLKDTNGNKIGVVVTVKDVTGEEQSLMTLTRRLIVATILVVIILSFLIVLMINRSVINPLKRLTKAGNKITDGEIDTPLPIIKTEDEIKDLSITIEGLVGALKVYKNKKKK